MNSAPLIPSLSILCKLGSIAVHVEELLSPQGHELDRAALSALLGDPELREWLGKMDAAALLPLKRGNRTFKPPDPPGHEEGAA